MARRRKQLGHTSNGRGNLLLERHFPAPIGELRMSSGTKDPQALKDIDDMLTALAKGVPPRWDILQAIADKRISPMYALSLWRMNKLEDVPAADVLPLLQAEYNRWTARLEVSDAYKDQIASTFRRLMAHGSESRVGDLPELLQARRDECQDSGAPVAFNRGKAHVQAFVRDMLGDDHALYREVTKVPTLAVDGEPERRAQTPTHLAELLQRLPDVHRRIAWSLAVTGMRPKEYFDSAWALQTDRVKVLRGKTESAKRDIPLWVAGLPALPERSRDAFEGMWERRFGDVLGIYDLRRSFKVWMEDAGITLSRIKIYMGHAAGDITGLYSRRELDAWLKDDAERLDSHAGQVVRNALKVQSTDKSTDAPTTEIEKVALSA